MTWRVPVSQEERPPENSADLLLEDLSFFEDLFHCHARNNDTSLTLDNAFDDVLNMIARCGCDGPFLNGTVWVTRKQ